MYEIVQGHIGVGHFGATEPTQKAKMVFCKKWPHGYIFTAQFTEDMQLTSGSATEIWEVHTIRTVPTFHH